MRQSSERRLRKAEEFFGVYKTPPDFAAIIHPEPLLGMLDSVPAKRAFLLITEADTLAERHRDRIESDFDKPQPGPLSYYIARWASDHSFRYPMGPYLIPEKLADWLLALPDQMTGYRPFDVCWDCGCFYPIFYQRPHPAKKHLELHPWLGHKCVRCGGWIVSPDLLPLDSKRNAPYEVQRREMESEWKLKLDQIRIADSRDSLVSLGPEKASGSTRAAKRKNERGAGPTLTIKPIIGTG